MALLIMTNNIDIRVVNAVHIKINGEYKIHEYTLYTFRQTRFNRLASGVIFNVNGPFFCGPERL